MSKSAFVASEVDAPVLLPDNERLFLSDPMSSCPTCFPYLAPGALLDASASQDSGSAPHLSADVALPCWL
jgi:hypothetical protein